LPNQPLLRDNQPSFPESGCQSNHVSTTCVHGWGSDIPELGLAGNDIYPLTQVILTDSFN